LQKMLDKMAKELEIAIKAARKMGHNYGVEFDERKIIVEEAPVIS